MALGMSAVSSKAGIISVEIFDEVTIYLNEGGTTAATDYIASDSRLQLIWSLDMHDATPGNDYALFTGTVTDGGAYVPGFEGLIIGDPDGNATYNNSDVGANEILNGYIFTRVFSTSDGTGNYENGHLAAASLFDFDPMAEPPDTPAQYNMSTEIGGNPFDNVLFYTDGDATLSPVNDVIPEPEVYALMGMAGLLIGIRQLRNRRKS